MSNPPKRKGTTWESAIVDYLQANGVPHAERRANGGARDRGDIAGIPSVVIEAKAERTPHLGQWLDEAEQERRNDGSEIAIVWSKRIGRASAAAGFVIMTPDTLMRLLGERAYIAVTEGAQP